MKHLGKKIFKFGKYKGRPYKDAQYDTSYLKWLYRHKIGNGQLQVFVKTTLGIPTKPFIVKVEDAVNLSDGEFKVNAHSKDHAIAIAKRKYNIQISQSGTTFSATPLNNQL